MKTYKEMMQQRSWDVDYANKAVKNKDWEGFSHHVTKALQTHKSSYKTWLDVHSGRANEKYMKWAKQTALSASENAKRQAATHKEIVDLWNKHQHNVPKDDPNRRRMKRHMKL